MRRGGGLKGKERKKKKEKKKEKVASLRSRTRGAKKGEGERMFVEMNMLQSEEKLMEGIFPCPIIVMTRVQHVKRQ